MNDGTIDAVYELVVGVDVRKSSAYDDRGKVRMRRQLYTVLNRAFGLAGVPATAVHQEDRGDGVLATIASSVPPSRIVGVWLTEVHEQLRQENENAELPLGLRIGLHVGPVTHDAKGVSGHAVDLACRLTDADAGRHLLERERADLVVVVSDSLYREVVRHGGRFVDPGHYAPARLALKDDEVPAWLRLPGRPRPEALTPAAPAAPGGPDRPDAPEDPPAPIPGPVAPPVAPGGISFGEIQVDGDLSVNQGNTYRAPVHIGRTVKGGHRA
ncbi:MULTISPECIES: hypothetical protein [Kitasatospora]|uniref:hypothetical protein n=1 Tax=Kitasatospora TaxID=2063 RepID=UPI0009DB26A3|nr:hypothetical protein [Kitasatospora setae]